MQITFVWIWSVLYPDYESRIAAMSDPSNIHNAFEAASMMFLKD